MKHFTPFDQPTIDRFWAKVDTGGACWNWIAGLDSHGYGQFAAQSKHAKAHRAVFLALGLELPEAQLDHTCHNRKCVNPSHLRPVTNKQNRENLSRPISTNTSGVTGVQWSKQKGKWKGAVEHYGKSHFLGYFQDFEDAKVAVVAKRNELYTHNDLERA